MRIAMQEADTADGLTLQTWDVGIVSTILDERGRAAHDFVRRNSRSLITIHYNPDDFTIELNGRIANAEALESEFSSLQQSSVVLETTTLGFVELLLCSRALFEVGAEALHYLYVEPLSYRLRRQTHLLHKRDFELSDEVPGYKAIPGATMMLSDRVKQRVVFFLGYEEARLDRAMEDYQMIQSSSSSIVFGVPAFKPGWEMDAFANNIRVITERNIRGGVYFCGAENPAASYGVLQRIQSELQPSERLFVAPIGTKPNGLGVVMFACENEGVGILYDHPKRRTGRTSSSAKWHLYQAMRSS